MIFLTTNLTFQQGTAPSNCVAPVNFANDNVARGEILEWPVMSLNLTPGNFSMGTIEIPRLHHAANLRKRTVPQIQNC